MAKTYDENGRQSRTITERKLLAMMNEGAVRGGATDAQIYQAYKEVTSAKDPMSLEKLLKSIRGK